MDLYERALMLIQELVTEMGEQDASRRIRELVSPSCEGDFMGTEEADI